jgi:hypothetical protein
MGLRWRVLRCMAWPLVFVRYTSWRKRALAFQEAQDDMLFMFVCNLIVAEYAAHYDRTWSDSNKVA